MKVAESRGLWLIVINQLSGTQKDVSTVLGEDVFSTWP